LVSDRTAFAIFLFKASRQEETFHTVSLLFRVAPTTGYDIFQKVLRFLAASGFIRQQIRFPEDEERRRLAEVLFNKTRVRAFPLWTPQCSKSPAQHPHRFLSPTLMDIIISSP